MIQFQISMVQISKLLNHALQKRVKQGQPQHQKKFSSQSHQEHRSKDKFLKVWYRNAVPSLVTMSSENSISISI